MPLDFLGKLRFSCLGHESVHYLHFNFNQNYSFLGEATELFKWGGSLRKKYEHLYCRMRLSSSCSELRNFLEYAAPLAWNAYFVTVTVTVRLGLRLGLVLFRNLWVPCVCCRHRPAKPERRNGSAFYRWNTHVIFRYFVVVFSSSSHQYAFLAF